MILSQNDEPNVEGRIRTPLSTKWVGGDTGSALVLLEQASQCRLSEEARTEILKLKDKISRGVL